MCSDKTVVHACGGKFLTEYSQGSVEKQPDMKKAPKHTHARSLSATTKDQPSPSLFRIPRCPILEFPLKLSFFHLPHQRIEL